MIFIQVKENALYISILRHSFTDNIIAAYLRTVVHSVLLATQNFETYLPNISQLGEKKRKRN